MVSIVEYKGNNLIIELNILYLVYGICKEIFLVSFEILLCEFWYVDMVCVVEIVFLIFILC